VLALPVDDREVGRPVVLAHLNGVA
jgi:hypothetical protein